MKILFASIPIVFFVLNTLAQSISTNRNIYSYDVGDVFHYEQLMLGSGSITLITQNIKITGKYYSLEQDTVFYIRDIISKTASSGFPAQLWVSSDTINYSALDSLVNSGIIDSVYIDTSLYNGRKINRDTISLNDLYVESLGKVQDLLYFDVISFTSNEQRLIYYRKGNEEWGNPSYLGIGDNFKPKFILKVYPNPAQDIITIELPENLLQNTELKVYNVLGQLVLEQQIAKGMLQVQISLKGFERGIYFFELKDESSVLASGKFVKE